MEYPARRVSADPSARVDRGAVRFACELRKTCSPNVRATRRELDPPLHSPPMIAARSTFVLSLALCTLLLASCNSFGMREVGWEGETKRWGSVVEVNRDGRTEGRVRVHDAVKGPTTIGIGALEGLGGELTIVDGATWTSRVERGGRVSTLHGAALEDRATFLVTADVDEWVEIPVPFEIDLRELADLAGFRDAEWTAMPFVVKGRLRALRSHVVNGACPLRADTRPENAPARRDYEGIYGTLVGFLTRDVSGTISHPNDPSHVHVVGGGDDSFTAHVEDVRVGAGSILRVPQTRAWVQRQRSSTRAH